jgi:hypothetical protein
VKISTRAMNGKAMREEGRRGDGEEGLEKKEHAAVT